ncbi:hypothetical protein FDUTEX481_04260 [Tolypothrix sp. PCC 7601]|nr:hypothetical protein FDUTEX481_04260 [Tolypothrix sp. PCC 7601]
MVGSRIVHAFDKLNATLFIFGGIQTLYPVEVLIAFPVPI